MAGYGGETPIIKYGTELTLESPATIATAIEQGDVLKIAGTATDGTGFKAAFCAAGDDPSEVDLVMALHRMATTEVNKPMGVKLLRGDGTQVRRLRYDGAAPTLLQSIEVAAGNVRKITGIAYAKGKGKVLAVNTATTEVEILI